MAFMIGEQLFPDFFQGIFPPTMVAFSGMKREEQSSPPPPETSPLNGKSAGRKNLNRERANYSAFFPLVRIKSVSFNLRQFAVDSGSVFFPHGGRIGGGTRAKETERERVSMVASVSGIIVNLGIFRAVKRM